MMQVAMMIAAMQVQQTAVQSQEQPNTEQRDTARAHLPAGVAVAVIVGFTPEHLAAAGVSAEQATTILNNLGASTLADEPLVRLLTSPSNTDAEKSAFDTSPAKLAQLRQEAMAVAGLSPQSDVGRKLTAVINSNGRNVPVELRVAEHTQEEWREIEQAVIAERRAQRTGKAVPAKAAADLSEARADADVAAARSGFESRKDAIEQVFNSR
jgi:hypothetical protein